MRRLNASATALMAMAARHRFAPLSERDRLVCLKWLAKMTAGGGVGQKKECMPASRGGGVCPSVRAAHHGFPAGILHLAHMAPYGPTFVVKITSYDTPYTHIFHWKRRLGIHEGHQIVHFHAYMQPSIHASRVSTIHSSISLMFAVLVGLM